MNESTLNGFDISAAALHIIAMTLMLMDHLWATLLPAKEWLTCAGRVAFPIFAFMAVEGYFHTRNFKKYMLRMPSASEHLQSAHCCCLQCFRRFPLI